MRETIVFRVQICPRDEVRDKNALPIMAAFNDETVEEVIRALRQKLLKKSQERKGYVLVSFGPF